MQAAMQEILNVKLVSNKSQKTNQNCASGKISKLLKKYMLVVSNL